MSEIDADPGNFDSAMKHLEKALVLNPDDFRIHNFLGELYISMDNIAEAAKPFNKTVGLHCYSADVYNNIGLILSQENKRDNAIKCFQKALSIMPDHQYANNNMEGLRTMQKPPHAGLF